MARRGRRPREFDSPIALARRCRGLSRKELAALVEVSEPYIYQLEAGYLTPGMKTAIKLADSLGVPIDVLVRGRGGVKDAGRNAAHV